MLINFFLISSLDFSAFDFSGYRYLIQMRFERLRCDRSMCNSKAYHIFLQFLVEELEREIEILDLKGGTVSVSAVLSSK